MKLLAMIVLALLLPAAANAIGWYAKWRGAAPIIVTVNTSGLNGYPDQLLLARQAIADWSRSSSVDYVEVGKGGKVSIDTNMSACGAGSYGCSIPNFSKGVLHGVAIHVAADLTFPLGPGWTQTVFCHELGHALGLTEVAGTDDTGSCMRADAATPSQEDYDELALMYPVAA